MDSPKLSIGDPIEARCTKCRKNSPHTILELNENQPEKVQCSLCERQHKYRPPTVKRAPGAYQAQQRKSAECKEWEKLQQSMLAANAKDYSMAEAYKVKTVISHPAFGLGIVYRVIGSGKIEILFEDGIKTMRCK